MRLLEPQPFASLKSRFVRANARNEAGGPAYTFEPKHALAQLAATGCFNGTYYAEADEQLATLKTLADQVADDAFLAKLAVYSRQRAMMKDMPVALLLALSKRDSALFCQVFDRVVDNGRTLRTLVQFVRSGQFGRKGLSYSLQRAVQRWLNTASVEKLLSASIGNDPSLRDVLRLARPTPPDNARRALFGWLTDKPVEKWAPATEADLPEEVMVLAAFRKAETAEAQVLILGNMHARWDLLADTAKGPAVWAAIARKMGPQALRMNLNTLLRHGVFGSVAQAGWTVGRAIAEVLSFSPAPVTENMVDYVAARLADAEEIRRSQQFPYQFLAAYLNASDEVPQKIKAALHRAAEIACGNVPELPGPVVIGLDVSGSMSMAVTGIIGDHQDLRGSGQQVDATAAEQLPFGLSHVLVARPAENIHRLDDAHPEGHQSQRGHAAQDVEPPAVLPHGVHAVLLQIAEHLAHDFGRFWIVLEEPMASLFEHPYARPPYRPAHLDPAISWGVGLCAVAQPLAGD